MLVLSLSGRSDRSPALGTGDSNGEVRPRLFERAALPACDEDVDHAHGVVEALVGVVHSHRSALGGVGGEQPGGCPSALGGGQLPHQVVHVGDAGVESQAAGGREPVGGVADQEDPAVAVALGDLARHPPRSNVVDHEVEVVGTGGGPEQRRTPLLRERPELLDVRVPLLHEHPGGGHVMGHEHAPDVRVHHPVQRGGPVAHQVAQVGRGVDHDEGLEDVGSLHGDSEPGPDTTARSVGRDHVPAGEHGGGAGRHVAQGADHLVGALDPSHPFDAVDQAGDVIAQDGFEPVLGQVAQRGRRNVVELVQPVLHLKGDTAQLIADQCCHPADPGALVGWLAGSQDPVHVHAHRPQDLEGPRADHVGGRSRLHIAAALHYDVVDPVEGQEQRCRQPDRSAAHHQDRGPFGQAVQSVHRLHLDDRLGGGHQTRPS